MSHNDPTMCRYCQKNPVKISQSRFSKKLIYCSKECRLKDGLLNYIGLGIIATLMALSAIFLRPRDTFVWVIFAVVAFLIAVVSFYFAYRAYNTKVDVLWYKENE